MVLKLLEKQAYYRVLELLDQSKMTHSTAKLMSPWVAFEIAKLNLRQQIIIELGLE